MPYHSHKGYTYMNCGSFSRFAVLAIGSLGIVTSTLTLANPQPASAQTLFCQWTGIACPQQIPGLPSKPSSAPQPPTETIVIPNQSPIVESDPIGYESRRQIFTMFPQPMLSTQFDETDREHIWKALSIAQSRIQDKTVRSCIKKYTESGYPGKYPQDMVRSMANYATAHPILRQGQGRELGPGLFGGLQYLFIEKVIIGEREDGSPRTLGNARLKIGVDNKDLRININAYRLTEVSPEVLAGIIIHEMLHNWGYDHLKILTAADFNKVTRNFVYEAGWCVQRNGADKTPGSFSLVESESEVGGAVFSE